MMFTEIVVPVDDPATVDGGGAWAALFGPALDLEVRTLHVEAPSPDPEVAERAIEDAIVAQLDDRSLLVMESEHADRWAGKASIAEHVVDRFGHTAVVVGPACGPPVAGPGRPIAGRGPVLVAVDGSSRAEAALEVARSVGGALGCSVEVVRVAATPLGRPEAAADLFAEAQRYVGSLHAGASTVVSSNDPVSALAEVARRREASLITLASRGDRRSPRPTIAKTCSGLVAASPCPVLIVGTRETDEESS